MRLGCAADEASSILHGSGGVLSGKRPSECSSRSAPVRLTEPAARPAASAVESDKPFPVLGNRSLKYPAPSQSKHTLTGRRIVPCIPRRRRGTVLANYYPQTTTVKVALRSAPSYEHRPSVPHPTFPTRDLDTALDRARNGLLPRSPVDSYHASSDRDRRHRFAGESAYPWRSGTVSVRGLHSPRNIVRCPSREYLPRR